MKSRMPNTEITAQSKHTEAVVSVENISKKFCRDLNQSLLYGVQDIATELVGKRERMRSCAQPSFGH